MPEIIDVRFQNVGKVFSFDPVGLPFQPGQLVVVETARGVECGEVVGANRQVPEEKIVQPLKPIIRPATEADRKHLAENHEKEAHAFAICRQKIEAHGLEMKLVRVEYVFDNSKILFYFTADGRVDFRELVKDLASVFRTRIELRQIGVRDEAKMLGGLGICGRPFCCNQFLAGFQPVSIKMAKEQGLSLNPVKISGSCGRLMCCLKYEQEAYLDLQQDMPPLGTPVDTPLGRGTVVGVGSLLSGLLQVRLDGAEPDAAPVSCKLAECRLLRGGCPHCPAQQARPADEAQPETQPQAATCPQQEASEPPRRPHRPRRGGPRRAPEGAKRQQKKS